MNYKEFVDELGLTLPQAREYKEELLELEKKADLGFKISLVHLALYPISILGAAISAKVFGFVFGLIFIMPVVALVLGGFKRLWRALMDITVKGLNLIPIFPINLVVAMFAFAIPVALFFWMPCPFFWKMRRNIRFDLEVAEDVIKDLEAVERA